MLLSSEAGSPEYVHLAFSPDDKYIIAQGGYPEWNAVLWLWEKNKVLFSVRTSNQQGSSVYQVSPSLAAAAAPLCRAGTVVLRHRRPSSTQTRKMRSSPSSARGSSSPTRSSTAT